MVDGMMGWTLLERRWTLGCSVFKICTIVVRSRLARAGVEMPAESGAAVVMVIPVDVRRTAGHGFGMALMSGTLWTVDCCRMKPKETTVSQKRRH